MSNPKIRYDIEAAASGAAEVDRLATELERLDTAIDPQLAERAREVAQRMRELGQQQAAIDRFVDLKNAADGAQQELDAAQEAAQAFARELSAIGTPTRTQTGQLEKLRDAVKSAKTEVQAQTQQLDGARAALTRFGIPLDGLAAKQVELRGALKGTAEELAKVKDTGDGVLAYNRLAQATDKAATAVDRTQRELESFRATIAEGQAPTRAQAATLDQLAAAANRAQVEYLKAAEAQADASRQLRTAGVNVEALTTAQARARAATLATAEASRQAAAAAQQQGATAAAAAQRQAAAAEDIKRSIGGVGDQLRTLQQLAGTVLGGQILGGAVGDVLKTADAYANLAARVKLVSGEGAAFDEVFQGVFETAKATNSSLENTGTLVARIATAGKDIGVTNQESLALTRTINQAIQLSGGSADAADAAITQLIQGLQSGVLRGEEFNSVMEQAPRLARALADGLGVPIGKLRQLAETGQLTSSTVIQALRGQREAVEREFGTLPATVGRAITNLQTEWTKFVGEASQNSGATSTIAAGINLLADNLQNVADVAGRAGSVLTAALAVQGVQALRAFIAEGRAATVTATALSTSLGNIPKVISITVAAVGFEVGFQIGEMLRENSALARQLGVAVAGFFQATVNDLRLVAESAQAIFTNDTVSAAFDRYKARAKELDESFSVLWDAAADAPTKVGTATDATTASLQTMGAQATATGAAISTAGTSGAASMGGISTQANEASKALGELAKAAGVTLPGIAAGATGTADALLSVVLRGGQAADVFRRELPEAISKLTGQDLLAFSTAITQTLTQAQRDSQRLAIELEAAGKSGAAELAKADAAARLLQQTLATIGAQAAKSLGVDLAPLSSQLSAGFRTASDNLALLVNSLPALRTQGVDTGTAVAQAIGGMIKGAQNQAEIDATINRLQALGAAGEVSAQQVADGLFEAGERAREMRQKIEDATPGVQSLGEAARRAGVDFDQLTTGVAKGFGDGITNITRLAFEIERAGLSAQQAGPVLAQALDQQLAAAKTTQEASALRGAIDQIIQRSPQLGQQLAGALEQARAKAAQLTPEMQALEAAAQRLGVTLGESTTRGANEALAAYEKLKASGKLSAEQLQQAFIAAADQAIRAANGVVPEWVKVESTYRNVILATDGTRTSLQGVADAAGIAGQAGGLAGQQIGVSFLGAAGSIDAATSALQRQLSVQEQQIQVQERQNQIKERADALERQRQGVDRKGFSTDTAGQTVSMEVPTLMSIINQFKGYGLDEKAAVNLAREFTDGNGNVAYFDNPGQKKYGGFGGSMSFAIQQAAQQYLYPNGQLREQPKEAAKKPAATTTQTAEQTKTLVIKLGGRDTTLTGLSSSNAQAIESLFRQLESGALVSGG